jgi:tetratricopeptide (TPR) repeat protein
MIKGEMQMIPDALDDIGILEGTDKSSLRWDYLRQYQQLFRDWRDVEFNLLEIGVAGGNSLFAWRKYFTQAKVIGVDIDEQARKCIGDRIEIEIGSQADQSFLESICDKYPPGIVIDDGSHEAEHIMASFRALFPRLAPGGWYVVEDLNITGGQDKVPISPHAFFTQVALALLNRRPSDHCDSITLNLVDRIDFARGIVFIRKKNQEVLRHRLTRQMALVWRTRNPNNYLWLAEQLGEQDDYLERAELAARRAVELHPQAAVYHLGLSRILQRRRKMPAAIEVACAAVAVSPKDFECHFQLAAVLLESGNLIQAAEAFERSIEVAPAYLRVHIAERRKELLKRVQ